MTGAKGLISATPMIEGGFSAGVQPESERSLPLAATQYVSATGVRWAWTASQLNAEGEERMIYSKAPAAYKPATRHALTFNTGVIGPDLEAAEDQGATRYGDYIDSRAQLFNDGSGHSGSSVVTDGFARLESGRSGRAGRRADRRGLLRRGRDLAAAHRDHRAPGGPARCG
ncbi:hypothetical protein ACFXKW_33610 [Streptomyces sp. NPDC059193]|uniref:hypothetical protein n=1 Tax=Streptomyces sp. NPDC059193 TaxID=3346763 RepID=UPI0036AA8D5F